MPDDVKPEPVPSPKVEPAPPAPEEAGKLEKLEQRVKVSETALRLLGKQVQELSDREAARSKLETPIRKPFPGFKPGVFKGR